MTGIDGTPVACNRDCGATCSLVAVEITGDTCRLRSNPLNHELKRPCPRGLRSPESRNAPDRLTRPMVRTGPRGSGSFRETSWESALDIVAGRLSELIRHHGAQAIMDFGGSGACKGALHNTGRLTARFLNLLGPVTHLSGSYSFQAASFALPYCFGGAPVGYDARTLVDTRFVILWGANICDTRFGNEAEQVIKHIRDSGGEVIVIDPRRTRTAEQLGTEWIPILPGTDTAAMLAIAYELLDQGLTDVQFIASHVHGADELQRYVTGGSDGVPRTAEWAAPICGIPAERIRDLARRYGQARPAALLPGFSVQRAMGGEDAVRMAVALQALTGNAGRPGGTPGTNVWFGLPGPAVEVVDTLTATGESVPKATWPEAILRHDNIRAAYVTGTNYLNQGSDIGMNVRAFESLELVICHELFLTPTARYADVVLPATHFLEREDLIVPEDNYLYYSAKIFEPLGESRDDFDIFADIARRLGFGDRYDEGLTSEQWVNRIIDGSAVTPQGRARFKATGIHDGGSHERRALGRFIDDPENNPLDTPSGRIEVSSQSYARTGFAAWPEYRPTSPDAQHPLMLVTPHSRLRINSTGSNIAWVRAGDPVLLWMNPADAGLRGISDGDPVVVRNSVGELSLVVSVTDAVMPGVVGCIEGGWLGAEGSANQVTPLEPTMPSVGTRTHTVFVEVSPGHDRR